MGHRAGQVRRRDTAPRSRRRTSLSLREAARRALASVLAVALALATPGVPTLARAQAPITGYDAAVADLERTLAALRELREAIDTSTLEPGALALDLAFEEPRTIADWVAENIVYRPYVGLLQGARGTLWSRSGNALDQAVLLAGLMGDAGYDARIARGRLPLERARALVERGLREPEPSLEIVDVDALRRLEGELAASGDVLATLPYEGREVDELPQAVEAARQARVVTDALSDASVELPAVDVTNDLIAVAQEYFWVQYRGGGDGVWLDAHPAFGTAVPDLDVAATELFEASVPAELQHRVRVQAYVVRDVAGERTRDPIMDSWERPTANAQGLSLPMTIVPDAADAELGPETLSSTMFLPAWMGQLPEGAMAFDLNGSVAPAAEAQTPFAGVFREVGEQANRAAAALDGLGEPSGEGDDRLVRLVGAEIEIDVIAPGGATSRSVHPIAERVEGESDEAFVEALLGSHNIAVGVGRVPPAIALDALSGRLLDLEPLWRSLLALSFDREAEAIGDDELARGMDASVDANLLYSAFAARWMGVDGVVAFRDGPGVLVYEQDWFPTSGGPAIDIVASPWTAVREAPSGFASAPEQLVAQGVWEATVESDFVAAQVDGRVLSAATAFALADDAGDVRVVANADDVERLRASGLPARSARDMRADLDAGHVLVLPQQEPSMIEAWWRVDPQVGATMGRIVGPRGGAAPWPESREVVTPGAAATHDAHAVRAQAATEDLVVRGGTGTVYVSSARVYGSVLTCAAALVVAYVFVAGVIAVAGSAIPGGGVLATMIAGLVNKLVQGRLLPGTQGAANRAFMVRCSARLLGLPVP